MLRICRANRLHRPKVTAALTYRTPGISPPRSANAIDRAQRAGGLQNPHVYVDRHWSARYRRLALRQGAAKGSLAAGSGRDLAGDHCRSSRIDVTDKLIASLRNRLHGDAAKLHRSDPCPVAADEHACFTRVVTPAEGFGVTREVQGSFCVGTSRKTAALVIRRQFDLIVLVAGVEFENLAKHAGRHR